MTSVETRIGEFACNCIDVVNGANGEFLVLLVCGDQERFVSRIVRFSSNFQPLEELFTIDTWLLAIHFDERRETVLCSTAGGRILSVNDHNYTIQISDLPFVSGFKTMAQGQIYAFGWHGCILKYDGNWTRLANPDKRRIFDLIVHNDQTFICGEAGLFSRLDQNCPSILQLPTNTRLRRMHAIDESLFITSEAPQLIVFNDQAVSFFDLNHAPGTDMKSFRSQAYIAFGYSGLFRWLGDETLFVSDCPAFKLLAKKNELVVLGDSYLTVIDTDGQQQHSFEADFNEMLKTYRYLSV